MTSAALGSASPVLALAAERAWVRTMTHSRIQPHLAWERLLHVLEIDSALRDTLPKATASAWRQAWHSAPRQASMASVQSVRDAVAGRAALPRKVALISCDPSAPLAFRDAAWGAHQSRKTVWMVTPDGLPPAPDVLRQGVGMGWAWCAPPPSAATIPAWSEAWWQAWHRTDQGQWLCPWLDAWSAALASVLVGDAPNTPCMPWDEPDAASMQETAWNTWLRHAAGIRSAWLSDWLLPLVDVPPETV